MAEAIAAELNEVLDADAFDVITGEAGPFADIATDTWTLRIEGSPVTTAWLSIDDEPEDQERRSAARRSAMPPSIEQALARADQRLEGALREALSASGDPLSLDLAAAITDTVQPS
jgi:hypothetical protein